MEIVTATRFKLLHRGRKRLDVAPVAVRKIMESPAMDLGGARSLRFCISTGSVDRERDVINQGGWDTGAFTRNPVVLWAHRADLFPVGRVRTLDFMNERTFAQVEFVPPDMPGQAGEFAETVYRMAKEGFLAATSVGFRPIEWEFTSDKARGADDWFPGIDFHKQELVELSIVTVPANPEALIDTPPAAPETAEVGTPAPPDLTPERALALALQARARRRRIALALTLIGGSLDAGPVAEFR